MTSGPMTSPVAATGTSHDSRLLVPLQQYWGYTEFRPLQQAAMSAVLLDRDSLVVLPTGAGKSLCYQVPSLCREGVALVVSPLLSLMKDQVDSLRSVGIAAARIHSGQSREEKSEIAAQIRRRELKLLYITPERLVQPATLEFLQRESVAFVAIDEAHCISQWGHDFRPEYRQLRRLREALPSLAVHGYTATATEQVRHDIILQLGLRNPEILVGSFDRPNLHYRVERRSDVIPQIRAILERHPAESGIIYCITRKNVEGISAELNRLGYQSLPYHAGLGDEVRRANQDAFAADDVQIIVATVAFGMGIDKSNVRFVIHAEMPRSLEHYQQESGRAGRDGLEAECCVLYSAGDVETWEHLLRDTEDPAVRAAARLAVSSMQKYCTSMHCRRQQLLQHFGQSLTSTNCGACDLCLQMRPDVDDALTVSQKILSCVLRLSERFGAAYTAQVLRGSRAKRVLENCHDRLSTWGLLAEQSESQIRDWIDQLMAQDCLQTMGEYHCLRLTATGHQVLQGEFTPRLLQTSTVPVATTEENLWQGVNRELFEALRALRTRLSVQKKVPPYIIFGDATLRELARIRPSTIERLQQVHGIGAQKLHEFGDVLLETLCTWCQSHQVDMDVVSSPVTPMRAPPAKKAVARGTSQPEYFALFEQRLPLAEVAERTGKTLDTVSRYLQAYLRENRMEDVQTWLSRDVQQRIDVAIGQLGCERLKPLYDHLQGEVSYHELRIAATCWQMRHEPDATDSTPQVGCQE